MYANPYTVRIARLFWLVGAILAALLLLFLVLPTQAENGQGLAASIADSPTGAIQGNGVITIGVASPLNLAPEFGWRLANSVQVAVDQVNAAGGIDIGGISYTVGLMTEDDGCSQSGGQIAASNMISAGVVAVVGHGCSGSSLAAQSIYAAAGIPMISGASTLPDLTEHGYTTTFRTITRDDSPAAMQATFMAEYLKLDSAAIVEWDGFTAGTGDLFENTFTSLGGTITSRGLISDTADFTSTLMTIMSDDPDLIFYGDDSSDRAGLFSATADGLGMDDTIIDWNSFSTAQEALDDYAVAAGSAAEGDYAGLYYRRTEDMPGYDALTAAYQAANFPIAGDEPGIQGAFTYDAAIIVLEAIDRADSTDPADIRDEVAATADFDGVVGSYIGFDAKGDVIPQWAWMSVYNNGRWDYVVPTKVYLPVIVR